MLFQVDPGLTTPLYEQLAASVRRELASGRLQPGARLPAAKAVADSLEVNLHTVLKAYQLLRDEGVIELRRGRGAVVRTRAAEPAHLAELLDDLLSEGRRHGLSATDLARLLEGRAP